MELKRKKGSIYLGYREDKPIGDFNKDSSRDCYWRANPSHLDKLMADSKVSCVLDIISSDVTVDSWAELDLP